MKSSRAERRQNLTIVLGRTIASGRCTGRGQFAYGGVTWSGGVDLRVYGDRLILVGIIELERYVAGVVAAELLPRWPVESLKAMAVAEKLDGTMKTHIGYAVKSDRKVEAATGGMAAVPHLKGVPPGSLAKAVASEGRVQIRSGSEKVSVDIPKTAAPIIARINGRSTLGEIAAAARFDPIAFGAAWKPAGQALAGWGLLWYSRLHLNG